MWRPRKQTRWPAEKLSFDFFAGFLYPKKPGITNRHRRAPLIKVIAVQLT
jgi:hypothetical protein